MRTKFKQDLRLTIELFDAKSQKRSDFSCGIPQIDNFLKLTAKRGMKADVTRVWVALDNQRNVIGYYGINMHSVAANEMPQSISKRSLAHGTLPAAFLSIIGVDQRFQGAGVGSVLLADALHRIQRVAHEIGSYAVFLDVFDCGDPKLVERRTAYYKSFGFVSLPDQPLRMFLTMNTIKSLFDSS